MHITYLVHYGRSQGLKVVEAWRRSGNALVRNTSGLILCWWIDKYRRRMPPATSNFCHYKRNKEQEKGMHLNWCLYWLFVLSTLHSRRTHTHTHTHISGTNQSSSRENLGFTSGAFACFVRVLIMSKVKRSLANCSSLQYIVLLYPFVSCWKTGSLQHT